MNDIQVDITKRGTTIPIALVMLFIIFGWFIIQTNTFYYPFMYESIGYIMGVFIILFSHTLYLFSKRRISIEYFKEVELLIILIIYSIISALLNEGGFRYAGTAINTIGVVILMSYCNISRTIMKIMMFSLFVATVICVVKSSNYYDFQYINSTINSNILAFMGLIALVYGNWLASFVVKKRSKRVFSLLFFSLSSLYIIIECRSRAGIAAWAVYVILAYMLPKRIIFNKKYIIWLAVSIVLFAILFSYYYVYKHTSLAEIKLFEGKTTTSRGRVWGYVWHRINIADIHSWIGIGTRNEMRTVFGYGAHNVYLNIWYELGLIGLMIYVIYICKKISSIYKHKLQLIQTYAIVGFISVMVYDIFGDEFLGPLAVWSYAILGLANQKIYGK